MKNKTIFNGSGRILSGVLVAATMLFSCTNLEIEPTDSIFQDPNDAKFGGVTDPGSFLDNMYNDVSSNIGTQENLFALSEATTDAALVPTRGSDWGDNGVWRQLHQHNWRTNHKFIEGTWNQWNNTQFQAAQIVSDLTTATPVQKANGSFLRALGVWVILDNFGQVPIRDVTAPPFDDPKVIRGQEAVDLIISDLNDAIAGLPVEKPNTDNKRPNKDAARYLLAKVLLNKHIYLGGDPQQADMQQVVTLVDAIHADGYGLVEGYFNLFDGNLNNETIWFVQTSVATRIWNGLHYNMASELGGGWNGFATLAEYYDMFEGDPNSNAPGSGQEERRGFVATKGLPMGDVLNATDVNSNGIADGSAVGYGFLIGQQYDDDGTPLKDRGGKPLTFKREFKDNNGTSSLLNNSGTTGIRLIKYNPRNGVERQHQIFFRYSDAHLMKAEALMRSGQTAQALSLVNELRVLRKATPLDALTDSDMLAERGRELYEEFWRRNDMIRFGQYTRKWELKPDDEVGDETRNLFPIPANQIILNPNLIQNPGY